MKDLKTINLQNGNELRLHGGPRHRNLNSMRYFCDHADYFYENRDFIFTHSRLFLAPVYQNGDFIYTLGGLMEWWESMPQHASINDEGVIRFIVAVSLSDNSFITITTSCEVKEIPFSNDYAERVNGLKNYCGRYKEVARDYEHLSLKNACDTIASLTKKRERELMEERIWGLYQNNIELLYEHREEILARKDWGMVTIPLTVYMMWQPVHIGTMLKLLESGNPLFTHHCECGHDAFIYSFAGSPLSGSTSISYRCVHCHKSGNGQTDRFLGRVHALTDAQKQLYFGECTKCIPLTELINNIK